MRNACPSVCVYLVFVLYTQYPITCKRTLWEYNNTLISSSADLIIKMVDLTKKSSIHCLMMVLLCWGLCGFKLLMNFMYLFLRRLLLHQLLPHLHPQPHPRLQHHHPLPSLSLLLPLKLHLLVEYLQAHLLRRLLRRRALN